MANLGDISKINLPNGNVVNVKDATARAQANWNTNHGVKNAAPVNTASKTNSGYFFVNKLGWVIKANEEYYIEFDFKKTAGDATVQLTDVNGNIISTTSTACGSASSGHAKRKVTPNVDAYGYNAYFNQTGTITISNLMIYPAFIEDDTYEPYALPNTKITPELIELVDSGAKNKLPNKGTMSKDNITYTWTNGNVVVSGTKSAGGNYVEVFPLTELSDLGLNTEFVISNNGTNCYLSIIFWSQAQSYSSSIDIMSGSNVVTIPTGYTHMLARLGVKSATTGTVNETIQPMICAKAAWDVSQKFVPYRPTYEETVEQVATNKNNISLITPTVKDSGNAFTVGTDYTLCDACTLTIPAPANGQSIRVANILASLTFNNSAPRGIILSTSNSATNYDSSFNLLAKIESTEYVRLSAQCTFFNYSNTSSNIYVWVKSSTSAINRVMSSMQLMN